MFFEFLFNNILNVITSSCKKKKNIDNIVRNAKYININLHNINLCNKTKGWNQELWVTRSS